MIMLSQKESRCSWCRSIAASTSVSVGRNVRHRPYRDTSSRAVEGGMDLTLRCSVTYSSCNTCTLTQAFASLQSRSVRAAATSRFRPAEVSWAYTSTLLSTKHLAVMQFVPGPRYLPSRSQVEALPEDSHRPSFGVLVARLVFH